MKPCRKSIYVSGALLDVLADSAESTFSGQLTRMAAQHQRITALCRPAFTRDQWERLLPALAWFQTDDWDALPGLFMSRLPADREMHLLLTALTEAQRIAVMVVLERWRRADATERASILDEISL